MIYGYIVLGAGSAGAAIAARLSEDPASAIASQSSYKQCHKDTAHRVLVEALPLDA